MRRNQIVVVWLVSCLALLISIAAVRPKHQVVVVEYLPEAVVFDPLTAAPGETAQQEVYVPVRWHYAAGTSEERYETATFALWSHKDHIITWALPHTNAHCSATGIIGDAA